MNWDVIVVGGGHNGLTTAGLLAKSGRKVLVLERRPEVGGMAASTEFHPGHNTRGLLLDTTGMRRSVAEQLELARHGLEFLGEEPPVLLPQADGPGILLHRDAKKTAWDAGGALPKEDGERYLEFREFVSRVCAFGREALDECPPSISSQDSHGLWQTLKTAVALRKLGEDDMLELLRVVPMSVADLLDEWFSSDLLKAGLAGPALEGTFMGPRSPGTASTLLLRESYAEPGVRGGPAALVRALTAAARENGAEVRTSAPVRRIRVADGAVVGVATEESHNFDAPIVVSGCDPKRTFMKLLDPLDVPVSLADSIRAFRTRGTSAKVNLALKGALEFAGRPGQLLEAARTGESLDDLERAFDAVKYRRFSEEPHLEIRIPTVSDPSLAPKGHHVVEILAHFAPHDMRGGWTPKRRDALGEAVIKTLARYAPAVEELVVGKEVLTPADLEERYGLTGGHIYHGELALDQLYSLRPNADCSRYNTPIEGLFLCGSGCHPGGRITCAPGALAADAILQNL